MLSHPSCCGYTGISRKNKMCHVFPLPKLVITMLHLGKWGLNIARSNPVQEYKQCGVQTNQTSNNKITHIDIITKTLIRQLGFRSIHFICFVGREHTFRQSWLGGGERLLDMQLQERQNILVIIVSCLYISRRGYSDIEWVCTCAALCLKEGGLRS